MDEVFHQEKPASVELRVVIRSGPDWGRLTREEFEAQAREFCRRVGRPVEQTVETARLWDATFRTTFCETRVAMKRIAQDLLARLPVREFIDGQPTEVRVGSFYLLTDDDDWCSPELPAALAAIVREDYDGVTWGSAVLGPLRAAADEPVLDEPHAVKFRPLTVTCHSNNYALTSEYFQGKGARWDKVFSHGHADEAFRRLRVCNVPRYLSVKNTNPASTVFLENGLKREFSVGRLRELVEQYNARLDGDAAVDDPRVSWARESIMTVRRFFRELADGAR